jgi:tetratricopeptide (TPR) repeat protein
LIDAAKNDLRHSARSGGDLRVMNLALGYAACGMAEDAEYWFEMFRARQKDSDPPISDTLELAMLGAGARWLSADLKAAESRLAGDDPHDAAYLLSYGGLAWIQAGNTEKGVDWLERGIGLYQREMVPNDAPDRIDYLLLDLHWRTPIIVFLAQRLAFAYRLTGNAEGVGDAMSFLKKEHGSVALPTDPQTLETMALTSVLSGDTDAAREFLRRALELGWANYFGIVNDRAWAETIQEPAFRPLMAQAKANNDRQRALVEAADAEHDFRAEFERLVTAASATD